MENIEKKLYCYSLFDKSTECYDVLVLSFNDSDALDYYYKSFNDIYKALNNYYKDDKLEFEKSNLVDRIHNSCIYLVGYFDNFKGEFINSKNMLIDLFDFKFNIESEEKKVE